MYRSLIALAAVLSLSSAVPSASAQGLARTQTGTCQPASYSFPGAIQLLPDGGAFIVRNIRHTISLLGNRALQDHCTISIVCASADNSKTAFEAVKAHCKLARDAIAGTQRDDSATKRIIQTSAMRPEDGYSPLSVNLKFQ